VLASIPLIVSGLEHYAEGVGTIKKWLKYKRELDLLVDVLATECVQFQGTCERFLEGLVDPDELDALIESPEELGGRMLSWKESSRLVWEDRMTRTYVLCGIWIVRSRPSRTS
jgi:uncharacterized protein YuzB (UPF0349 family)